MKRTLSLGKATAAFAFLASLIGCGGSGDSGTSVVSSPYAGTYAGELTLDGGKKGALAMTVASSGKATGTLKVSAAALVREAGSFNFPFGDHSVSGTIGADGSIQVTGNISGVGVFNVAGKVGKTGSTTLLINAGGTTYTGTISYSTGGGGGGGTGSLKFSNGQGTNANLSAFSTNPFVLMSTVGDSTSWVAALSATNSTRAFSGLLGSSATPGATVTLGGANFTESVLYTEGAKSWMATSGSIKVIKRTATTMEIQLVNVKLEAETDTGATGSFVVNGTVKK